MNLKELEQRWAKTNQLLYRRQRQKAKLQEKIAELYQQHNQLCQEINSLTHTRQFLAAKIELQEDTATWEETA